MTPSGIEPATFRLVAQRPNQLRHEKYETFQYVWWIAPDNGTRDTDIQKNLRGKMYNKTFNLPGIMWNKNIYV